MKKITLCVVFLMTVLCGVARADVRRPIPARERCRYAIMDSPNPFGEWWDQVGCDKIFTLAERKHLQQIGVVYRSCRDLAKHKKLTPAQERQKCTTLPDEEKRGVCIETGYVCHQDCKKEPNDGYGWNLLQCDKLENKNPHQSSPSLSDSALMSLIVDYDKLAVECNELNKQGLMQGDTRCSNPWGNLSRNERVRACRVLDSERKMLSCEELKKRIQRGDQSYKGGCYGATKTERENGEKNVKQAQITWEFLGCKKILQHVKKPIQQLPPPQAVQPMEDPQPKPAPVVMPQAVSAPVNEKPQKDFLPFMLIGLGVFFVCGVALWLLLRARKK